MSIIAQIKAAQISARKNKSFSVGVLTTLIGEAEMVGKNACREVSDAEVTAMVKKFIKNIDETINVLNGKSGVSDKISILLCEREILEEFLPKQLLMHELESIINLIHTEMLLTNPRPKIDMGAMMKILKERFDGRYDGKMASTIIRNELSRPTSV